MIPTLISNGQEDDSRAEVGMPFNFDRGHVPMRWLVFVFLCMVPWMVSGCSTTKPWQRETLARPEMAPDGDGDREALRHHVLGTREGAVGGFGGGGGGCGCN